MWMSGKMLYQKKMIKTIEEKFYQEMKELNYIN